MANAPQGLPPIPSDIAYITGPSMLGICLNWGFMGILVVQAYYYYVNFPKDSIRIKALVYGLFLLDILQTCMVTADAFHWFVFGFGNMDRLDDTFLNSWDVPMLDALIGFIVQCFYSWRIYILSKSRIFPFIIVVISTTQCACGIATASLAQEIGRLSLIRTGLTKIALQTTWLVGSAVADILITVILSWTLLRARSKELSSSRGMIDCLVILTVETNGATALTAMLGLILFLGFPNHTTFVVPPTAIIGKLYTNCLIAVFNNRRLHAPRSVTGTVSGSTISGIHNFRVDGTELSTPKSPNYGVTGIQVLQDVSLTHDEDTELKTISPPPSGKDYNFTATASMA